MCICHIAGMNRHHFAVFVHNCRLVLLLRQEPGHGVDLNTFKPAEWRWKLAQVCDGDWHHYALSVDFPQVRVAALSTFRSVSRFYSRHICAYIILYYIIFIIFIIFIIAVFCLLLLVAFDNIA